jgi:hypothetical protein
MDGRAPAAEPPARKLSVAPLGVWRSSQLARRADGDTGWRLQGHCCTRSLYCACFSSHALRHVRPGDRPFIGVADCLFGDQVQAWLHADVRLGPWLTAAVAVAVAVNLHVAARRFIAVIVTLDAAAPNTSRAIPDLGQARGTLAATRAGMRATLLSCQPWRGLEFMRVCASLWMNCAKYPGWPQGAAKRRPGAIGQLPAQMRVA